MGMNPTLHAIASGCLLLAAACVGPGTVMAAEPSREGPLAPSLGKPAMAPTAAQVVERARQILEGGQA